MKNKRGMLVFEVVAIAATVVMVGFGHIQYKAGNWGANGSDNLEARQAKHDHINNESRWYDNDKFEVK